MACWTAADIEAVRASKFRLIIPVFAEDVGAGLVVCSFGTTGRLVRRAALVERVEEHIVHVRFTSGMACMDKEE